MGILVERVRHGWGSDSMPAWHGEGAEVVPFREGAEAEDDDPLAPARGAAWGLLFSAIFWVLLGTVAVLL